MLLDPDTSLPGDSAADRSEALARLEKCVGNKFYTDGDYTEAEKHYATAINFTPFDAVLHTNRAAACLEKAKSLSRRSIFQRALEDGEGSNSEENEDADMAEDPAHDNEAPRRQLRRRSLLVARESAEVALELDPSYIKAYWRKGQVLMELGQFREAIATFKAGEPLGALKQLTRYAVTAELQCQALISPLFDFSDLVVAQALLQKIAQRKRVPGYRAIVPPRQVDVWQLVSNARARKLLKNPTIREALTMISETPSQLPLILCRSSALRSALHQLLELTEPV